MTHRFPGNLGVTVCRVAQRPQLFLAKPTVSAADSERNNDSITLLQVSNFGADLLDDPHRFVAQNIAFLHRRHEAIEEMEIRSANGSGRNANDHVSRILNRRIRD
jgi:hypothetical protein